MPTDYTQFRVGGVVFPLSPTASTPARALRDADPGLFYALDYYMFAIRKYVGARIVAECVAGGVKGPNGQVIDDAVKQAASVDPTPNLGEAQLKFPLLAIYRTSSKSQQHTSVYFDDVGLLKLAYVLPPLTAGQRQRMLPLLQAVKYLLHRATQEGWDPDYTPPGGQLGKQWFQLAGIEEIWLDSAEHGDWGAPGGELSFPGIEMVLQIKDRGSDLLGLSPFQAIDVTEQVTPDGTSPLDAVLIDTSVTPPDPGA